MTQGQRLSKEVEYLSGALYEMLGQEHDDTESYMTIVHTLGRILALVKELHALFDITLIEEGE